MGYSGQQVGGNTQRGGVGSPVPPSYGLPPEVSPPLGGMVGGQAQAAWQTTGRPMQQQMTVTFARQMTVHNGCHHVINY